MYPTTAIVSFAVGLLLTTGSVVAEAVGERLYFESCAVCHGEDGMGAMPGIRNLTEKNGPLSKPTPELVSVILNGVDRPGLSTPMPAKGGNDEITPSLAREIVKFMQEEFAK